MVNEVKGVEKKKPDEGVWLVFEGYEKGVLAMTYSRMQRPAYYHRCWWT